MHKVFFLTPPKKIKPKQSRDIVKFLLASRRNTHTSQGTPQGPSILVSTYHSSGRVRDALEQMRSDATVKIQGLLLLLLIFIVYGEEEERGRGKRGLKLCVPSRAKVRDLTFLLFPAFTPLRGI